MPEKTIAHRAIVNAIRANYYKTAPTIGRATIIAVAKIMFRLVSKAVQRLFHDDISIRGITCAPWIGDEIMTVGIFYFFQLVIPLGKLHFWQGFSVEGEATIRDVFRHFSSINDWQIE